MFGNDIEVNERALKSHYEIAKETLSCDDPEEAKYDNSIELKEYSELSKKEKFILKQIYVQASVELMDACYGGGHFGDSDAADIFKETLIGSGHLKKFALSKKEQKKKRESDKIKKTFFLVLLRSSDYKVIKTFGGTLDENMIEPLYNAATEVAVDQGLTMITHPVDLMVSKHYEEESFYAAVEVYGDNKLSIEVVQGQEYGWNRMHGRKHNGIKRVLPIKMV